MSSSCALIELHSGVVQCVDVYGKESESGVALVRPGGS